MEKKKQEIEDRIREEQQRNGQDDDSDDDEVEAWENYEEYLEAQQAMADDMSRQLEEESRRQRMTEEAEAQDMEEQQRQQFEEEVWWQMERDRESEKYKERILSKFRYINYICSTYLSCNCVGPCREKL